MTFENSDSNHYNSQNGNCRQEATYTFNKDDPEVLVTFPGNASNCCGKRVTLLEKRLFHLLGMMASAIAVLVVVVLLQMNKDCNYGEFGEIQSAKNVCLTTECIVIAADVISRMDPSADPCDDFNQYACGGWFEQNIIPEDNSFYGTFSELMNQLSIQCKVLLEEPVSPEDTDPVIKAKHFYESCIDEDTLDSRGVEPLREFLQELGGWPVTNDGVFNDDTWSIEHLEATIHKRANGNSLFLHLVSTNALDSSRHITFLDQPDLGLREREHYLQNFTSKKKESYLEFMTDMATVLREDNDREAALREMQETLDFEAKLAKSLRTMEESRGNLSALYQQMTIAKLNKKMPNFNWMKYLNLVHGPDMLLTEEDEIVCQSVPYMISLNAILGETPNRTIANYILWRIVQHTSPLLGKEQREIYMKFVKVKYGESKERARWNSCYGHTNNNLGEAMGLMFLNRHFSEENRNSAVDLISKIRTSMKNLLEEATWLDDVTREGSLLKVDSITEQIGFSDDMMNTSVIAEQYKDLDIRKDRFFENLIDIWAMHAKTLMSRLGTPVVKGAWRGTPVIVNAAYSFVENFIRIPAGILQPPFFMSEGPSSLNYGGIGVVIGHELMHAFDDRGRLFDWNGNLRNWWEEESVQAFDDRKACIVKQYSSYTVEQVGQNVNGAVTIGETIADNGGMNAAFKAYKMLSSKSGEIPQTLPGVNLTHEQLFFINFGQVWCSLYRDETLEDQLKSGVHPPESVRIKGPLANSDDFARVFNCPSGSTLNKKDKCKVW